MKESGGIVYMNALKRGEIAVDKKALIDHCKVVHEVLNNMDALMKQKESVERGRKIAKCMNALNLSLHGIEHFQLGIPLKSLGNKYPGK